MRRLRRPNLPLIAALAITALPLLSANALAAPGPGHSGKAHKSVCAGVGVARCQSEVVVDSSGKPQVTSTPAGYGPADLQGAYA